MTTRMRFRDNCDTHAAGMTKKRALELSVLLEQIRKRMCQYGPEATRCDCKYTLGFPDARLFSGEQSGCCELREASYFLERWAKRTLRTSSTSPRSSDER